ncbi:helicase-exonuclease AddAB subunit AddB [Bacillaceae bacterium]
MSLRLIIGPSGSGKSAYCLEEIRQRLQDRPLGPPLIYLVPEQMTFQAEVELAKTPGLNGMIRAQVLSFRRLAWNVLQEVGGITRRPMNRTGTQMLLRKILEHRKDQLKIFARAAGQMGFTGKLAEIYAEMKRYMVSPQHLLEKAQEIARRQHEPGAQLLAGKLHDLHRIFQDLEEFVSGRYLASEDFLRLLVQRIPQSRYVREAEIWIDGFHGFTPQEYAVIASLVQYSKRVSLTLCLDRSALAEETEPFALFAPTAFTYRKITEITKTLAILTETVDIRDIHQTISPRFKDPALAHLERNFGAGEMTPYPEEVKGLSLTAAVNRRTEVEAAARQILTLVREKGYRWREIAVLVRDMESYQDLFETVFADYGIPVFLDRKRAMSHHPLIELIRSALEAIVYGWKPDAVFRCVKTDFFIPETQLTEEEKAVWRNRFDQLENEVLARGIRGERWTQEQWWRMGTGKTEPGKTEVGTETGEEPIESPFGGEAGRPAGKRAWRLHELRELIVTPLRQLEKALKKSANVRQMCTALFHFLTVLQVPEHLEQWSRAAQAANRLERVREHSQAWQEVVGLLDQLVELMGEEKVSLELFAKLIEAGMEGMQFALVPPALDQVLAGSLGRTRTSGIRAAFILGINDGVLPATMKEDGIFLETEREALLRHGLELAPGSKQKLMEEQFLIYATLTSPSEYLYLSYPLADEEGKSLQPSEIIQQIKRLFPRLEEQAATLETAEEPVSYIHNPRTALSLLAAELRKLRQGQAIAPVWLETYNWFIRQPAWRERAARLLKGLFYRNQEERLQPETVRRLYGTRLRASISRLEKFQACPFAHFASYGLRLGERDLYRLEAPDIGQLYHACLRRFLEIVRERGMELSRLPGEEVSRLAAGVVDELAPGWQNEILLSTSRYQHLQRKLKQVVVRTAAVLAEHAKRSQFSPVALELPFGPGEELPSLSFQLANGCVMELVGRIDRVDRAEGTQGVWLRIIDYKSGKARLHLDEVYYGLSLQMLVYLDVVISQAERWLGAKAAPAGMLYFRVHNPVVTSDVPLSPQEAEQKILAAYKMNGYLLADVENVRLMDTELTSGWSQMLPVALTRDERFYAQSKVLSPQQLDLLRRHVREVVQKIGTAITDGVVDIRPYKLNKKTPCTLCPYKPVCQFDPLFEGEHYRLWKKIQPQELWRMLAAEGGEAHEHDPGETGR